MSPTTGSGAEACDVLDVFLALAFTFPRGPGIFTLGWQEFVGDEVGNCSNYVLQHEGTFRFRKKLFGFVIREHL